MCYNSSSYRTLPGTYKIRNAKNPGYWLKLYQDDEGEKAVVTSQDGDESQFTIVVPPARKYLPGYLLFNKRFKNAVLNIGAMPGYRGCTALMINILKPYYAPRPPMSTAIQDLTVQLRRVSYTDPSNPSRVFVMIGAALKPQFLNLNAASILLSTVSVVGGDPGNSGYWYFEPDLPSDFLQSLYPYQGETTSDLSCYVASNSYSGSYNLVVFILLNCAFWWGK